MSYYKGVINKSTHQIETPFYKSRKSPISDNIIEL
jgi:hypothetical protein